MKVQFGVVLVSSRSHGIYQSFYLTLALLRVLLHSSLRLELFHLFYLVALFRPPSDGGLMILPETFCDVIVEAITYLFFIFLFFKRSARFKRNFRHNCMPVLGLAQYCLAVLGLAQSQWPR